MSRKLWTAMSAILCSSVIGCGPSDDSPQPPAERSDGGTRVTQAVASDPDGPAASVDRFLNAFRAGDDQTTEQMLTQTAREQAAAMSLQVAPPGTDTAKFKLGRVAYLPGDRAAVDCEWTDLAEIDGQMQMRTVEYLWMLRREPEGWRIAGVAVPFLDGEPPLQLDFENLQQMQEKLQWAQQERLRRASQGASQARTPENSQNSVRR
ncbi:MAG: hypothetical protein JXB62_09790 [Pirellulales bacterium]|nr:hypothetical protein [Pirellulales bacterium]